MRCEGLYRFINIYVTIKLRGASFFSADDIFKQFFGSTDFGEEGISTRDFFDTILDKTNRLI